METGDGSSPAKLVMLEDSSSTGHSCSDNSIDNAHLLNDSLILELRPHEPLHRWHRLGEWEDYKRSKHTLVAYGSALYVFGGECDQQTMNDLLRFDLRTQVWSKESTSGTAPARRYNHSAVVFDHRMFVFGGYTGDVNKNDLHEYRFAQTAGSLGADSHFSSSGSVSPLQSTLSNHGRWMEWKQDKNPRPVPRTAHGAAVYDSRLWIVAGYDGNSRLADMWCMRLDTSSSCTHFWEEVEQQGSVPPPRCNFPIAVSGDSMLIFSGESGNKYHHKLFQFDFRSRCWTCLDHDNVIQLLPPAPEKRFGHTMVAYGRHLYLFGGTTGAAALPTALHQYDLDARQWEVIRPAPDSQPTSGRLYHSAAVADGVMYIFGGYKSSQRTLSGELFRMRLECYPKCTLQQDFAKFFESRMFSDLVFHVGSSNEPVKAHAAFVAARSGFLKQKIIAAQKEQFKIKTVTKDGWPPRILHVHLPDAEPQPFELVLSFIYTDQLRPATSCEAMHSRETVLLMMQVYKLAIHYQMARLQHVVHQYLEAWIREENVLAALQQASKLELDPLREYCLSVLVREPVYGAVVRSAEFEQLDKILMVEIVRRKAVGNSRNSSGGGGQGCVAAGGEALRMELLETTNSLQRDMEAFLASEETEFADVWLVLYGQEFPAHSAVLAARSAYFEAMFRSLPPANQRIPVIIGDQPPSRSAFNALLRYIYFGDEEMRPADSMYLLHAPSFFAFTNERLQVFCKNNIERNINHNNVVEILEAAYHIKSSEIKDHALSIITRDFRRVMREPEIRKLPQELLLSVLDALAETWPLSSAHLHSQSHA